MGYALNDLFKKLSRDRMGSHELERTGQRRALITLCIGYGMGIATIIDRKFD